MTNREFRNEIAAEIRMYRRWRKTNPDLRFAAITAVNTLKTFAERVPADSFFNQAPAIWVCNPDAWEPDCPVHVTGYERYEPMALTYNADNPLASRDICRLAREA